MTTATKRKAPKLTAKERVTNEMIKRLEESISNGDPVAPWQKPWKADSYDVTVPTNAITKKEYNNSNFVLLSIMGTFHESNMWAGFQQWSKAGYKINKGSKATNIIRPMSFIDEKTKGTDEEKTITFFKAESVFNYDQVTYAGGGLDPIKATAENKPDKKIRSWNPIKRAEKIASDYISRENITLNFKNVDSAFYATADDSVTLTLQENFKSAEDYYDTYFHELGHSTGSKSRLNRSDITKNYSNNRACRGREELVAELTSSILLNHCGITDFETGKNQETIDNQFAYIRGWIEAFKRDSSLILDSASRAIKASEFIEGV